MIKKDMMKYFISHVKEFGDVVANRPNEVEISGGKISHIIILKIQKNDPDKIEIMNFNSVKSKKNSIKAAGL